MPGIDCANAGAPSPAPQSPTKAGSGASGTDSLQSNAPPSISPRVRRHLGLAIAVLAGAGVAAATPVGRSRTCKPCLSGCRSFPVSSFRCSTASEIPYSLCTMVQSCAPRNRSPSGASPRRRRRRRNGALLPATRAARHANARRRHSPLRFRGSDAGSASSSRRRRPASRSSRSKSCSTSTPATTGHGCAHWRTERLAALDARIAELKQARDY